MCAADACVGQLVPSFVALVEQSLLVQQGVRGRVGQFVLSFAALLEQR
jgi:hypothetical protein